MSAGNTLPIAAPRGEADRMPVPVPFFVLLPAALVAEAYLVAMGLVDGLNATILLIGTVAGVIYASAVRYQNAKRKADAQAEITAIAIARTHGGRAAKAEADHDLLCLRFDAYRAQTAAAHAAFDARLEAAFAAENARIKRIRDGFEAVFAGLRADFDARIAHLEAERDKALGQLRSARDSSREIADHKLANDTPKTVDQLRTEADSRVLPEA